MAALSLKKRFISTSAGTLSAVFIFGIAFAAQPDIAVDAVPENEAYTYAQQVTDEDMAELEEMMDEDILNYVKDALVEDSNSSIIMAYTQQDEDFVEVLAEYYGD